MNLDRQPLGAADPDAAATGRAAAGQEPHTHPDQSKRLMVKCPACNGGGKITLRQKSEHRDGKADWLNPVPGEFWTVTIHPDGHVDESVRRK